MTGFNPYSDDFYINLNLNTEMDLPHSREVVLNYFERLQKTFPDMRHFHARERNEFVIEEEKDRGNYRWATVEPRRICSGQVNPPSVESALEQHRLVLELAPYMLTLSPLDCESINVMYGFDFNYRGNHNELVMEALGIAPALERLLNVPGATLLGHEPAIQLALDDRCRTQCRLSVETRTSAFHVRSGEYPEEHFSVYFTVRRYGSLESGETFGSAFEELATTCHDLVENHVVEQVLRPLQQAIAARQ